MPEVSIKPGGPWSATVELTVPFYDLDPMNVVWHGNYAKYFERARCALLDAVDYGYAQMRESGFVWPVVDMQVRFIQPLTFGQVVAVTAEIEEWDLRLKLAYRIADAASGQRLSKGSTVQVAVDTTTKLMCLQSPNALLERLGVTRA